MKAIFSTVLSMEGGRFNSKVVVSWRDNFERIQ